MKLYRWILSIILLGILINTGCTSDKSSSTVDYNVTINRPHNHIITVEMKISHVDSDEIEISMPVWTPGAYHVLEHSKHVFSVQAIDSNDQMLPISNVDKNTWKIECKTADTFLVKYQLYAREPNIRMTYLSGNGGHIIGANLFMFVNEYESKPVTAKFNLPKGWKIEGSLIPGESDPTLFSAESYHRLIDSPMLIGEYLEARFEVDGKEHFVGILGATDADPVVIAEHAEKVIRLERDIFGGLPYEKYAIVVLANAPVSALEHACGTSVSMPPFNFNYKLFDDMFTHEFFHLWNVKRIKPPAFDPYDYEAENYTDSLWFYEGFSSYHSYLFMYQLGYTTEEQYLKFIADRIASYRDSTAKDFQSVTESSFNAWIKHYDKTENTNNVEVDYYDKGILIGHVLNLAIADATNGENGLSDLFRLLWHKAQEGETFSTQDIQTACEELTGSSFADVFTQCVYGKGDIPFESYFSKAGLDLVIDETSTEQWRNRGSSGLSFAYSDDRKSLVVKRVVMDGPAWNDSVLAGDKIFAVNGVKVEDPQAFIAEYYSVKPGETAQLAIQRNGTDLTIELTFGERTTPYYLLRKIDNPVDRQKMILKHVLPGQIDDRSAD